MTKQEIIDRKVKNLWIIERYILDQMKYNKSETSKSMSILLDFPNHKDDPPMSRLMQKLKAAKLLKYNKTTKEYSVTALGKEVQKQID
ncbi:hypothetical protein LCGC14_1824940 [marine sediment metagenome]|uniref:ArnR1-like winged helix-turn-helix domain-containing protein n=1 Tax=marine sediment metagenome TaxID=412755 RepID=A0A0F9JHC2_9ZZZZ